MEGSKVYYGGIFLDKKDLKETKINHRIELEYYKTNNHNKNVIKETPMFYGIEVVKKEYKSREINIETSNVNYISNNANKVIEIIEILKKHKVTPIGLQDVVDDLLKNKIAE